jgi:hypothetical protein
MTLQFRRRLAANNAAFQALRPTAIRELVECARARVIGAANGTGSVHRRRMPGVHARSSAQISARRDGQALHGLDSREVRPFTVDDEIGAIRWTSSTSSSISSWT